MKWFDQTWYSSLRHLVGIALLCCAATGCHSLRIGSILNPPPTQLARAVQASFGTPTAAPVADEQQGSSLRQVVAQEKIVDQEQPVSARAPAAGEHPIDLETALRLAGVDNPTIALAEEAVRARLAERMQVRSLLFPTLDVGSNLRLHRGNFLTSRGVISDINIQSLYYGFGADAKGAGTVNVPGLRLVAHLADAYYAPQAAQQRLVQSRFDATTARHSILLEVGVRYLALVEAGARLEAYRQSIKDVAEIARSTANFAKTGQGRDSDAQRARSELLLLRADAERAEEELGVAAAELARLLDLDPTIGLRPADLVPPLIELVDPGLSLSRLLDIALRHHPEIVARSANVAFNEIRLRQERVRPFLPLVAVGFSAGDYGGGSQSSVPRLQNFSGRTDLDIVAVWSLQNLGLGTHAVQNGARTSLDIAQIELARLFERIRREVAEAYALTQARRQEMDLARQRVETSQRAYQQDLTRTQNAEGRPIEVLTSANQLAAARQDLVRARIGYSQAQLQLFVALGNQPGLPPCR